MLKEVVKLPSLLGLKPSSNNLTPAQDARAIDIIVDTYRLGARVDFGPLDRNELLAKAFPPPRRTK